MNGTPTASSTASPAASPSDIRKDLSDTWHRLEQAYSVAPTHGLQAAIHALMIRVNKQIARIDLIIKKAAAATSPEAP